jgi:hypothetical protein
MISHLRDQVLTLSFIEPTFGLGRGGGGGRAAGGSGRVGALGDEKRGGGRKRRDRPTPPTIHGSFTTTPAAIRNHYICSERETTKDPYKRRYELNKRAKKAT